MKATLSFVLPEEKDDLDAAMRAADYRRLICDIEDYVKSQMDHGDLYEDEFRAYDDVLSKIRLFAEEAALELH